jgi:hypothetical protein
LLDEVLRELRYCVPAGEDLSGETRLSMSIDAVRNTANDAAEGVMNQTISVDDADAKVRNLIEDDLLCALADARESERRDEATGYSRPVDKIFPRRRTLIRSGVCVFCGGPAMEFRDEASMHEFRISGLCQNCQDKVFDR